MKIVEVPNNKKILKLNEYFDFGKVKKHHIEDECDVNAGIRCANQLSPDVVLNKKFGIPDNLLKLYKMPIKNISHDKDLNYGNIILIGDVIINNYNIPIIREAGKCFDDNGFKHINCTFDNNRKNAFNNPSKDQYINYVIEFLKYYFNDIDFSTCANGGIIFYMSPDNGIIYTNQISLMWKKPFKLITLPNIIFYTGEVLYDKEKILNEDFDFGKVKSRNLDIEEIGKQLEASIIPKVEDWLKEHGVKDYSIESTGDGIYVDVNNHLNLANYKMMSLPNYFQFRRIAGNCNLANNLFTSWNNMPLVVLGDCLMNFNKLNSFNGCEMNVHGVMTAERQRVKTLYPLNDINYHKYMEDPESLTESLVYVDSLEQYGNLQSISKDLKSCLIKLNETGLIINMDTDKVTVVNAVKYIKRLSESINR